MSAPRSEPSRIATLGGAPPWAPPRASVFATPSPAAVSAPSAPTSAACALDAEWLSTVTGRVPIRSKWMHFDAMRRRAAFGDGPPDTNNGFHTVRRSSEEKYEWASSRQGVKYGPILIVLRDAEGAIPSRFTAPVRHASGVVEHRHEAGWGAAKRRTSLFVFPDRTWVLGQDDVADGVRASFATTGQAPPLPSAEVATAWELCGSWDQNDLHLPFDVWSIRGQRVAARLFESRQEGELVYTFPSAEQAARAAAAQSRGCAERGCPWVAWSVVAGSSVHYGITIRRAPTAQRDRLEIAHATPRMTQAPSPSAPPKPGSPPSGVYERFLGVRSDSDRPNASAAKFHPMTSLVLITHRNGKPFATLPSLDPIGRGMTTSSPVEIELTVGSMATKSNTEHRHLCRKSWTTTRKMIVLALSGDSIRVRDEVHTKGNYFGCDRPDIDVRRDSILTFQLARKFCGTDCDAMLNGPAPSMSSRGPAPYADVACACPPVR